MSRKPRYCPKCLGQKIRLIMYGMPTSEAIDKANAGKIALGGCCISDESPKWRCETCEYEFGKAMPNPEDLLNWEPDGIKPLKLEFYIGGYSGPNHILKLENGILKYKLFEVHPDYPEKEFDIVPTARKWLNFRKKLDSIGVWKWKRSYHNSCVCDGTQWEFEVDYGVLKKKTHGSNRYPGSTNKLDMDQTPEFKMFLQALNRLFGRIKLN